MIRFKTTIGSVFVAMAWLATAHPARGQEPPRDVVEVHARLEAILGKPEDKDQRQFRITVDKTIENRPEEDKPLMIVKSSGEIIVGTPYRSGDAISFDLVESINRTVYERDDSESDNVVRRQQRYLVAKYTLRQDPTGAWAFDAVMTAHSVPSIAGKPFFLENVEWQPDGLILTGISEEYLYGSEGKLIPAAVHGKIELSKRGDDLVIEDVWQAYHRGTGPDGTILPFPDFERPIGDPNPWLSETATLD